jgi:two-component system, NarL family, response regulator NreC
MKIKILLADDHKIMREGLKTILEKQPEFEVTGEASTGKEAIDVAIEKNPDVIIMDINMPDLNGIEATLRIKHEKPSIKILALSMHDDRKFLINMLKAGASGYLLKDCASDELIDAIKVIRKNRLFISPDLVDDMVRDFVMSAKISDLSVFSILTKRERDVLQRISEGRSTKEIAFDLNVSVKTVETFRYKIEDKTGLHSIAELTKYAIREGITTL